MIKGIDVSGYQGTIDWKKVKADGVEFAILKVIRKDLNADKKFEANYKGCIDAGMPIQGVYNYSYATSVDKAKKDAKRVVEILNGRKPFVWLDVEDKCQQGIGHKLIEIINAYAKVIKDAGLDFGIYTGLSFYKSYIAPWANEVDYPFWIARYPSKNVMTVSAVPDISKKPIIANQFWGWQYSSKGSVKGITGNVDMNAVYVALEAVKTEQKEEKVNNTSTGQKYYTVKRGDTLTKICNIYSVSLNDILKMNSSISNKNLIYVGQKIRVQ